MLDMGSEWSASAEAYTVYFMEGPDGTASHFEMQVGRKPMVTSVATFLKAKVKDALFYSPHHAKRPIYFRCAARQRS